MKDKMQIYTEPKKLIIDLNAKKNADRLYSELPEKKKRFLIVKVNGQILGRQAIKVKKARITG